MQHKNSYSTFEAAKIIGVSAPTIIKWSNDRRIKVYRTPGGHRRIAHVDLLEFAAKYNYPIFAQSTTTKEDHAPRILVINSDIELGSTVKEFLENNTSCIVDISDDPFSIGLLIGLYKPDVLLFDVSFSSLDALQTCRKIRKISALKTTKIIAYASIFESKNYRTMNEFDGYLLKTDSMQRIVDLVDGVLAK